MSESQSQASRRLVIDAQMFTVDSATMRVQVFTGDAVPPVLVLTQTLDEGLSLTNGIEKFAAVAWQRLLPDVDQVPIVIQYLVPTEPDDEQFSMWQTVAFDVVDADRSLHRPRWTVISSPAELVGAPVAADRGEHFVPLPPEPQPEIIYRTVAGADLPVPQRLDYPCMKTEVPPDRPWWKRTAGGADGGPQLRSCCWYHRGDWAQASRSAINLVNEAIAAKVPSQDIGREVVRAATESGTAGWQLEAVASLVIPSTAIILNGSDDYTNGQHRAWVMREQQVPVTIAIC